MHPTYSITLTYCMVSLVLLALCELVRWRISKSIWQEMGGRGRYRKMDPEEQAHWDEQLQNKADTPLARWTVVAFLLWHFPGFVLALRPNTDTSSNTMGYWLIIGLSWLFVGGACYLLFGLP